MSNAGPVNSTTLPTLNLASAVSTLPSLTNKEKANVKEALETSSVEFSQMEDTFNKKRFKRKWVQSTTETSSLGQKTRMIVNLVDTANKSKQILFEFNAMHSFSAITLMNKETNLTLLESSLYSQLMVGTASRNNPECDREAKYRKLDGSCNNLASPQWGATATPMPRLMDNAYSDGKFLTFFMSL